MVQGIRKEAKSVAAYVPGKTTDAVIEEYRLTHVVKLGSNENNYGPFPHALEAMQAELARLNIYPEKNFVRLKDLLGEQLGLDGSYIGIGHGAGGVLETITKAFIESGDEVIIPRQTYNLYKEISKIMGGKVVFTPLKNYTIDLDNVMDAVTPKTKLIWLCNPNNPTSTVFDRRKFDQLLGMLPPAAWVVLDEAYREYAPAELLPDPVAYLHEKRNLMTVRTFSKYYGLAGGRIGYLIADPAVITYYDTVSEPFNANRIGLAGAVTTLLEDRESVRRCAETMLADRERMAGALRKMGCLPVPSRTNFVFFETPYPAEQVGELLLRRGVIIRPCLPWNFPRHVRVSVGTTEENDRFLEAMRDVLVQCGWEAAQ